MNMHSITSGPFGNRTGLSSHESPQPGLERAPFGRATADPVVMKWAGLQDAAAVVATLAGLQPDEPESERTTFSTAMRHLHGWRRDLAERSINDISAVMETGIAALISAQARGSAAVPAARALWNEYIQARSSVLAIIGIDHERSATGFA
ncbi:MAG: hypothetical protein R3E21_13515 [Caenibius sp.]